MGTHGQRSQEGWPRALTPEPRRTEPFVTFVAARLRPTQQRHSPHTLKAKTARVGESRKLDSMMSLLSAYDVREVVRSGKIVMARGTAQT